MAPVREGDEIDVKIEAIGDKGDGIAKKDGFVLVVPGTQLNDEVKIRITKVLRKVGFAEVVSQGSTSEDESSEELSESEEAPAEEASEETPEDEEVPKKEVPSTAEETPVEDSEDF